MDARRPLLKKLLILYIYLHKEILHLIKTGKLHSILASEEKYSSDPPLKQWLLKLMLRALILSFLVFFTMVYIHQGSLIFNEDGSAIFNRITIFEFSATVLFLFLVFLVHRGISKFINNYRLANYDSFYRGLMEAILVIISTVILLYLCLFVPFRFIFPNIEIPPDRIRFNNVVMAIITLFFYYFVERERSKKLLQKEMLHAARLQKENFQAQLQSLKSQVSPHFLFNSLNVLRSLILQDPEKASDFTERLSDLYRAFLENSDQQLIPLKKELEVVKSYIFLLETRFGSAVKFELDISAEVEQLQLPPGALQMLIENAIKHNGSTRKKPLRIKITVEEDYLCVENNLQPRLDEVRSTNTGLENIRRRYDYFTDREVEIQNSKEKFIVKLPLLKIQYNENSHN
ncbi:sensor histidine kinase [Salinimicrobium sp. TH3]|uniref:sensor histidine kinase n=1 Tax=Salinimicrobium sp. TH3 TaxID=2997342 RepID=UPI0022740B3C|nr:histidine kinase [Salinimicrobium sp. TH3]MCY2687970.1 histidine kinase [Salinimicrobium sp. TH3]